MAEDSTAASRSWDRNGRLTTISDPGSVLTSGVAPVVASPPLPTIAGMPTQQDKAAQFLALHRPGAPLLMPNPWDRGSARLLESLGFEALATTSSGFAMTLGRL